MQSNKGFAGLAIQADEKELLSVQLHYNLFLTQEPIKIFLDKNPNMIDNESLKHMIINKGNHSLSLFGPELSLDETCILISFIEYETPVASNEISSMPGVNPQIGVQSVYVNSLQKGVTNIALPSFKNSPNETIFVSTLLLHFDSPNRLMSTTNTVELDLNFDTESDFDFYPQIYYESAKDKLISYVDISEVKPSADIEKQIEVIHVKDNQVGSYVAHMVFANGNTIGSSLDVCNNQIKVGRAQTLSDSSSFYYNDFGREDFTLGILKNNINAQSKFYDAQSDVFYIEVVYEIKSPSFIEVVVEYDITLQNVDLYVFREFNDKIPLEDQELASSTLEIPNMIESTISRHTSIYLSTPGKYSVFIIDKRLPMMFKHLNQFDEESPCALLKISHSIQPFSPMKLQKDSLGFVSSWPRRIDLTDPFFIQPGRNFEVDLFPNSLEVSQSDKISVKFAVIDMATNKKLYNIDPDRISVAIPSRKVSKTDGSQKFFKEVRVRCFFKEETISNVIGGGKILTLANPEKMSDKSFVPYYVIVAGSEPGLNNVEVQPNKTSTNQQQVKDKLTLKQQRQQRSEAISMVNKCKESCKHGDCSKTGACICRRGWMGVNCETKKKFGKFDKIKQKDLIQAKKSSKRTTPEDSTDEDFDYDDDEGMLDEIKVRIPGSKNSQSQSSSSPKVEKYQYGWFDVLLLMLLLFGIALVFYQNLWSGRFCRKKFYKKLKFEDEDEEKEDYPVIHEEMELVGESLEMPRIRKKHDD